MISVRSHLQPLSGSDISKFDRIKDMKYLLIVCFQLIAFTILAQDRVIIERDGKRYYAHEVLQGQTLYAISKYYNVEISEIEKNNLEVSAGLKPGQSLLIPVPEGFDADTWQNPIRIEGSFMIHRVKRKETLYSISKDYKTDINKILEHNQGAEISLKPGDELKIPVTDIYEPPTEIVQPGPMDSWQKHTVLGGETLFGISKYYNVTIESIQELNGGLKDGLKVGQVILIPVKNNVFAAQTKPIGGKVDVKDTLFLKDRYRVVVMLPFELDAPIVNADPKIQRLREIAMDFYRGSLLALDSLKNQGARLEVTYMDVTTQADAETALKSNEVKNANLIIGPLQRGPLEMISEYAARKGIHIVCPVPQSNKILLKSPNLSKVIPSRDTEIKVMANYIAKNHKKDNIILINSKDVQDARMVQLFRKHFAIGAGLENDSINKGYYELSASSRFVGELSSKLSKSKLNILVVPAGDVSKSMIANLQTKLQLISSDYNIRIFAVEEWLEYDFLDVSFKERFHLTVPTAQFADYNSQEVTNYIKGYRGRFKMEPSDYSMLGYDIMTFYGRGMAVYGVNFPNHFNDISESGLLDVGFSFTKTGLESGFENEQVFLLTHQDYFLQPIGYVRKN